MIGLCRLPRPCRVGAITALQTSQSPDDSEIMELPFSGKGDATRQFALVKSPACFVRFNQVASFIESANHSIVADVR